jgi:hypothetical protein
MPIPASSRDPPARCQEAVPFQEMSVRRRLPWSPAAHAESVAVMVVFSPPYPACGIDSSVAGGSERTI